MTAASARDILNKWKEMGVSDPEQLRKLLVARSLTPLYGILFQTGLDLVASLGAFWTAGFLSTTDIPFHVVLETFGYFIAFYYFINVMLVRHRYYYYFITYYNGNTVFRNCNAA